MCKVQLCPGAGDEDRHPEADAERQGREHQEAAGDAADQGRGQGGGGQGPPADADGRAETGAEINSYIHSLSPSPVALGKCTVRQSGLLNTAKELTFSVKSVHKIIKNGSKYELWWPLLFANLSATAT